MSTRPTLSSAPSGFVVKKVKKIARPKFFASIAISLFILYYCAVAPRSLQRKELELDKEPKLKPEKLSFKYYSKSYSNQYLVQNNNATINHELYNNVTDKILFPVEAYNLHLPQKTVNELIYYSSSNDAMGIQINQLGRNDPRLYAMTVLNELKGFLKQSAMYKKEQIVKYNLVTLDFRWSDLMFGYSHSFADYFDIDLKEKYVFKMQDYFDKIRRMRVPSVLMTTPDTITEIDCSNLLLSESYECETTDSSLQFLYPLEEKEYLKGLKKVANGMNFKISSNPFLYTSQEDADLFKIVNFAYNLRSLSVPKKLVVLLRTNETSYLQVAVKLADNKDLTSINYLNQLNRFMKDRLIVKGTKVSSELKEFEDVLRKYGGKITKKENEYFRIVPETGASLKPLEIKNVDASSFESMELDDSKETYDIGVALSDYDRFELNPSRKYLESALQYLKVTPGNEPFFQEILYKGKHMNYDWRFFKHVNLEDSEIAYVKSKLVKAWFKFCESVNVDTWISTSDTNTLNTWYKTGLMSSDPMPVVVEVPIQGLQRLQQYNSTLIMDLSRTPNNDTIIDIDDTGASMFLFEISPHLKKRTSSRQNGIDARLIDLQTGLFLDINALLRVRNANTFVARSKMSNLDKLNLIRTLISPEYYRKCSTEYIKTGQISGKCDELINYSLKKLEQTNLLVDKRFNTNLLDHNENFTTLPVYLDGVLVYVPGNFADYMESKSKPATILSTIQKQKYEQFQELHKWQLRSLTMAKQRNREMLNLRENPWILRYRYKSKRSE